MVTFDQHPAAVVRPESAPRLLTDLEQRLELLEDTGVDYVARGPLRPGPRRGVGGGLRPRGPGRLPRHPGRGRRPRLPFRLPAAGQRGAAPGHGRRVRLRRHRPPALRRRPGRPAGVVDPDPGVAGRRRRERGRGPARPAPPGAGRRHRGRPAGPGAGLPDRQRGPAGAIALPPTASTPAGTCVPTGPAGRPPCPSAAAPPSTRKPTCRCSRPTSSTSTATSTASRPGSSSSPTCAARPGSSRSTTSSTRWAGTSPSPARSWGSPTRPEWRRGLERRRRPSPAECSASAQAGRTPRSRSVVRARPGTGARVCGPLAALGLQPPSLRGPGGPGRGPGRRRLQGPGQPGREPGEGGGPVAGLRALVAGRDHHHRARGAPAAGRGPSRQAGRRRPRRSAPRPGCSTC